MSATWFRRMHLGAALVLCAALLAACSEALLDPVGSDAVVTLGVSLAPSAAVAGTSTDAFARTDGAHVRVAASATSSAVLDTVVAVSGSGDRSFALPVQLSAASGSYLLSVTLTSRGSALFQGSTQVRLRRGYHENVQLTLSPIVTGIALPDTLPSFTAIGDSVRVLAAAVFASGDTVTGVLPTWSDDGGAIVRASPNGVLTSLREGEARLTASYQGITAASRIRVQAVVTRIDMSPDSIVVYPDSTRRLLPVARDRNGNTLTRSFGWRSADTTIAVVDTAGRVRGVAPGRTFVSASVGAQSGRALVIVLPTPVASVGMRPDSVNLVVGDTLQVKATPLDASGKPLAGRLVTWSVSKHGAAAVDSTGLVTALLDGRDTVFATSEGKVGITIVKVYQPGLGVGATQIDFTAVLGQGNPVGQQVSVNGGSNPAAGLAATTSYAPGQPTGWLALMLSGPTTPATLTLLPNISGLGLGSYAATVTLTTTTSSRITGVVNVTLTITSAPPPPPASVASVRIVPHSATLPVGAQQQLSGTALSATGTPLSTAITWTSLDPSVVSVTQAGMVTGVAVGSGRVVASAGGHADTATVTVTASSPVVSVQITPRSATIPLGGQQTLSATVLDATGAALPYTPTWTSLDPAIVTVTQAGVVTGIAPGTGRVLAIVLGVADTATVTVTASPVTVAAVQISPRTATIAVGGQQQLTATALDAAGNALPVPITWVSLDPGIVSVSPTGLLTGIAVGSGRISAAAGGKADTVTVTVTTSVPVASLKITPHSAVIQVGGQQQFTATVLDAAGNPLPYTATWTSLDPALLSVTQTGLVTGLATGKARVVATVQGMADTALVTIDGHLGRTSTTPLTVGELSVRAPGGLGSMISLAAAQTLACGLGSEPRTLCRGPIARGLPASGSESRRRLAAGPVTDQTEPWPTRRRARGAAGQGAAWTVS